MSWWLMMISSFSCVYWPFVYFMIRLFNFFGFKKASFFIIFEISLYILNISSSWYAYSFSFPPVCALSNNILKGLSLLGEIINFEDVHFLNYFYFLWSVYFSGPDGGMHIHIKFFLRLQNYFFKDYEKDDILPF